MENKGESDHFLEILENLEILGDSSSEKTPVVMTPFSGLDSLPEILRAQDPQNDGKSFSGKSFAPTFCVRGYQKLRTLKTLSTLISDISRRANIRSRPGKPNQRKGQNEKLMNFAHFCEFWCFYLGKQARFTLNFCSGTPLRKVHELTFLWFGLPGPLLIIPKNPL